MTSPEIIKEVNEMLAQGFSMIEIKHTLIDKGLSSVEINAMLNSIGHESTESPTEHHETTLVQQKEHATNANKIVNDSSIVTSQVANPVQPAKTHVVPLIVSCLAIAIMGVIVCSLFILLANFIPDNETVLYLLMAFAGLAVGFSGMHFVKKLTSSSFVDAGCGLLIPIVPLIVIYAGVTVLTELTEKLGGATEVTSVTSLLNYNIANPGVLLIIFFVIFLVPFCAHILTQKDKWGIVLFVLTPLTYFIGKLLGSGLASFLVASLGNSGVF